jgi:hypothetical protein
MREGTTTQAVLSLFVTVGDERVVDRANCTTAHGLLDAARLRDRCGDLHGSLVLVVLRSKGA